MIEVLLYLLVLWLFPVQVLTVVGGILALWLLVEGVSRAARALSWLGGALADVARWLTRRGTP